VSRAAALLRRTTLRVRLVAAMVALVVVGLGAVGTVSVLLVRQHLISGVDDQIGTVARDTVRSVVGADLHAGTAVDRSAVRAAPGTVPLPSQFVVQRHDSAGRLKLERRAPVRGGTPGPAVPTDVHWLEAHLGEPATVPATEGGGSWRVVTAAVPGAGGTVVVGLDLSEVDGTVSLLAGIEAAAGGLVAAVLAAAGALIVRSSLRPLVDIERTAAAIASGDLSRRVPDRDPRTEVGSLGRALNAMLAQIEGAFAARARSEDRMRRFVADAGHELRTPLAVIQGFAEHYRRHHNQPSAVDGLAGTAGAGQRDGDGAGTGGAGRAGGGGDLDGMVGQVERTAARMGRLVSDLLLLARLDARRPLRRDPVDLLAVVGEAVRDARLAAPDRDVRLHVDGTAAYLVTGDEERLGQVLANLIGNALRHTPAGTTVRVGVATGALAGAPAAVLAVADDGPGLTAEQAARVFDRFYRAEESRHAGGSGLGLSIVDAVVAAHGGTVAVGSVPGAGATFRVTLPLAGD
jgi:two-component system OmpR family sensor kinase